ncbi:hypothetical protein Pint_11008 [Pistacia integerrima]|uniref:Uncharacterized protein n=1 Tax=Pistacia integerrima TaxID=434235 RepID=A0ACC0XH39_9ROSI|nr:hypothetical protein Pint_11008 [Pistacia integerrima]
MSFKISLARPALAFDSGAILALYSGNTKFLLGVQIYLLSRDHSNLKSDFQHGNGKPAVELVLGKHVFLSVGEYYLRTKTG